MSKEEDIGKTERAPAAQTCRLVTEARRILLLRPTAWRYGASESLTEQTTPERDRQEKPILRSLFASMSGNSFSLRNGYGLRDSPWSLKAQAVREPRPPDFRR